MGAGWIFACPQQRAIVHLEPAIGHTAGMWRSNWVVNNMQAILIMGLAGMCSVIMGSWESVGRAVGHTVADGVSSTGDIYEPVYPAIGHIVGMSRLR